tara:strand:+ start:67 stop:864 length:798 start_codon:yes stop_codon:yes gene_type:complete
MANILAPITLIGLGRSGTSFLEKAFDASESVYASGETLGLLIGTYAGALDSFFDSEFCDHNSRESFAASIVRKTFLSLFPIEDNNYNRWFHKPAGIPKMIDWNRYRGNSDKGNCPVNFYWEAFDNVFPNAEYLTVLRNPWDIVASRIVFSGWDEEGGWEDINSLYELLEDRLERMHVIFFDDLIERPEEIIKGLFANLKIDIPSNIQEVIETKVFPTQKDSLLKVYKSLKGPSYIDSDKRRIIDIWERYGKKFANPINGKLFFER